MDSLLKQIREMEASGDLNELGGFLINLAKTDSKAINCEQEFEKHLHATDWRLKKN
jgi:hypothetical protein